MALADHLPGGYIEGGDQRSSAVSAVVVSPALGHTRGQWQDGLGAIERLDLALLVEAQDQGLSGGL